jgi:Spy/CpxP family protein refolding chaperone
MKRAILILLVGLLLCLTGFAGVYYGLTARHRAMMSSQTPELAWLQKEFHLSDAELNAIQRLHDAYLPQCAALCARIEERNQKIRELLAAQKKVSPEIEALLRESADLRLACQENMLKHFVEVSRAMPPDQGARYLAWVQQKTLTMPHEAQNAAAVNPDADPPHHHAH